MQTKFQFLYKEGSETYQTWHDFESTKYFTFGKVPQVASKGSKGIDVDNFWWVNTL